MLVTNKWFQLIKRCMFRQLEKATIFGPKRASSKRFFRSLLQTLCVSCKIPFKLWDIFCWSENCRRFSLHSPRNALRSSMGDFKSQHISSRTTYAIIDDGFRSYFHTCKKSNVAETQTNTTCTCGPRVSPQRAEASALSYCFRFIPSFFSSLFQDIFPVFLQWPGYYSAYHWLWELKSRFFFTVCRAHLAPYLCWRLLQRVDSAHHRYVIFCFLDFVLWLLLWNRAVSAQMMAALLPVIYRSCDGISCSC